MSTSRSNVQASPPVTELPVAAPVEPLAVIGLACRFPGGVHDADSFWDLLRTGGDAITEVPASRWSLDAHYSPDRSRPGKSYVRHGGFLDHVADFDAAFFGISPREAMRMDPQQRLALELAWEAFEDAGLDVSKLAGSPTSVYVAVTLPEYNSLLVHPQAYPLIDSHTGTGLNFSIVANRISYQFDLRGPSVAVDTACSGSLVAVHHACQTIWHQGCAMALAGGVNLNLKPDTFIMHSKASMLSPTGRCRPFDASADGFVRSEGGGLILLKPLSAAQRDGDPIRAVIRGSAVNQDGRTPSLTMPSGDAQIAAIRSALSTAEVKPHQIQYVEAHGPGTQVGDPIEAGAIGRALGVGRSDVCRIGSVKSNIGHLEAAAGIAGLIKLVLSLQHRQIPPTLHHAVPNPRIPLGSLRLQVATSLEPWPANPDGAPRLAGVNSFGFGGTNAHAVLAEPPPRAAPPAARETSERARLLVLSARSEAALASLARAWEDRLADGRTSLDDLCFSALARRSHHAHRLAVVGADAQALRAQLRTWADGQASHAWCTGRAESAATIQRPVFVFSGMGQQWPHMARRLLEQEPRFRETIAACEAELRGHVDWSISDVLANGSLPIDRTDVAQVSIFAVQVGLAALWQVWGIAPGAVVGHSVGEVAAAHVAGALSLADAMLVVRHRSRLQATVAGQGSMLAVDLTEDEIPRLLHGREDQIAIAAVNGPRSITLAGSSSALAAVAEVLTAEQRFNRYLKVEVPYHSPLMDPLMAPLVTALAGLRPERANVPLASTVTGTWLVGDELGGAYWARNIREPVRFARALQALSSAGHTCFLEVSAHPVLVPSLKQSMGSDARVFSSLRRDSDERTGLLATLGGLYCAGALPKARGLFPSAEGCVSLPGHPWQRTTHWQEAEETRRHRLGDASHPLLGRRLDEPQPAWEVEIDLDRLGYLQGHRIQGEIVFPYTAYCEMAMTAARQLQGLGFSVLSDVVLERALILESGRSVRMRLDVSPDGSTFSIHSRGAEGGNWNRHVQGRLASQSTGTVPAPLAIDEIRRRCPHTATGDECYRELVKFGYDYAPTFQGVQRCWYGSTDGKAEALYELAWPAGIPRDDQRYLTHPAVMDAYLNGVVAVLVRQAPATWLPVRTEESVVYQPLGQQAWMHMQVTAHQGSLLDLDLTITDAEGRISTVVRGMRYRALAGDASVARPTPPLVACWEPVSRTISAGSPRRCLVWGEGRGTGGLLAARIVALGGKTAQVVSGQGDVAALLAAAGPVDEVIHLRSFDGDPEVIDPTAAQELGSKDLLGLAQALAKQPEPPRLWIITRAVHPLAAGQTPQPAHAPLWGLGRVLANEWPSLRPRLVDLQHGNPAEVDALAAEIFADGEEQEIGLCDSTRFAHRLKPLALTRSGNDVPFRLVLRTAGGFDGLAFEAHDVEAPGPGQVAIDVMAAGLNFKDVVKALDLIDDAGLSRTYAGRSLGFECAGRVSAVGPGVDEIRVGDEVMGLAGHCFATSTVTEAAMVARKPAGLSFEEAAACPVVTMTAYAALVHFGRLQAGERVLIHTAAGGVGQAAVQIARALGATIFATAGSDEKRAFLRAQGIEHVADSRSLTFASEISAATHGQGIDLVVNTLPVRTLPKSLSLLRPRGRLVDLSNFYGDGQVALRPFQKGLTLVAFDLDQLMRSDPKFLASLFHEAMAFMARHHLSPPPRRSLPMAQAKEAFRHLGQGQNLGKVVLTRDQLDAIQVDASQAQPPRLARDASYLVTGGTGGFGLATAQWLAEQGAGSLVLLSRRGLADAHAEDAVAKLRRQGVQVTVLRADVAQRSELAKALREIRDTLPPLRGVVHAATIYADRVLERLTPADLDQVLGPKAFGAWHLHELTRDLPLDLFVLFSSIAGTIGNPGQGSYAAANVFLDALADHRHALGLPVTCVAWGGISDVGYLAREAAIGARLAQAGIESLSPRQALRQLGTLLRLGIPRATVAPMNWQAASERLATLRTPHFEALVGRADASLARERTLAEELASLDQAGRIDLLSQRMARQAAKILGTPVADIDRHAALTKMGLDSLMAVELSQQIKQILGLDVASMRLLGGDSLARIAESLLAQIAPSPASVASASTEPVAGPGTTPSALPALGRRGQATDVPLSFQQMPMWKLERRHPGAGFYNLPTLARCQGPLDVASLGQAFAELVHRHEALRFMLGDVDGNPVLRFVENPAFEVPVEDLRSLSPDEREQELQRRWQDEQVRPFDLTRELPLRARILLLGPEASAWIVVVHHLAGDGASFPILFHDLYELYRGFVEKRPATLPKLPVGYGDFSHWQHQTFAGEAGAELITRWRGLLDDRLPALPLPADRPPSSTPGCVGARCRFTLSLEVTQALQAIAREQESTLFMALLTALGLLVHRSTGCDDFALGTFVANRVRPEVRRMVGCFVNALPLRIRPGADPSFRSALVRVRASVLEAQTLAELPFALLVDRLADPQPLQVVLILHNELGSSLEHRIRVTDTIEVTHQEGDNQGAKRDWTFHLFEGPSGLSGFLEYDTERFDATSAEQIVRDLRGLVESLVRAPDQPLARLAPQGGPS